MMKEEQWKTPDSVLISSSCYSKPAAHWVADEQQKRTTLRTVAQWQDGRGKGQYGSF